MKYARLIWLPLVFVGISGCSGNASIEVTIPSSAVQTGLDAWMPIELTNYVDAEQPATVTLETTEVLASDGTDRIGLKMHLTAILSDVGVDDLGSRIDSTLREHAPPGPPSVSIPAPPGIPNAAKPGRLSTDSGAPNILPGKEIFGDVYVRVGIRYVSDSASFYCHDVEAERVEFEDLPDDMKPKLFRLCESALNQYFAENAVYTLDDNTAANELAKSSLKNLTVRDGMLVAEIGI